MFEIFRAVGTVTIYIEGPKLVKDKALAGGRGVNNI